MNIKKQNSYRMILTAGLLDTQTPVAGLAEIPMKFQEQMAKAPKEQSILPLTQCLLESQEND